MTQTPTKAEVLAELREDVAGLLRLVEDHRKASREAAAAYRAVEAERDALQRKVQEMALQALADDTQHREVEAERDDLKLAFAHTVRLVQDWQQSAYAMEAERDALRADAERWRFALTQPYEFWKRIGFMGCAEDQNEAIDAAMKGTT